MHKSTNDQNPILLVAAAVMRRGEDYCIARRAPGQRLAGFWEFPGGKVHANETPEAALKRELHEELGIDAAVQHHLTTLDHDDGQHLLRLLFYAVAAPAAPMQLRDHDAIAWVSATDLPRYPLAAADLEFAHQLAAGLHKP